MLGIEESPKMLLAGGVRRCIDKRVSQDDICARVLDEKNMRSVDCKRLELDEI